MTNTIYIHQPEKAVSFTRLPNFLFEAPTFTPLSNEAKVLYAFILRRTELSRKNGWADEYGRIFLYYPICEVVALLHCGRQKAVNTLRELQYAGLVEIQKQGCGKPNRIYPKSYEAVPNTDLKKSSYTVRIPRPSSGNVGINDKPAAVLTVLHVLAGPAHGQPKHDEQHQKHKKGDDDPHGGKQEHKPRHHHGRNAGDDPSQKIGHGRILQSVALTPLF